MTSKTIRLKPSINENLFVSLAIIVMSINFLFYAFFDKLQLVNPLRYFIIILLLIVYFVKRKFRIEYSLWIFWAIYLILINGTESINVAFLIIFAIAMNLVDERKIYKWITIANIFIVIIVAFSLILGIEENFNWTHMGRTRNTLGFEHPNYIGMIMFSIVSVWFLYLKKIKWRHIIFATIVCYILFRVSDSRTGFIGLLIFAFFCLILKAKNIKISKIIVGGIIIFYFLSPIMWSLPFINNEYFNDVLSSRPEIFYEYIVSNSFTNLLFGGTTLRVIDNFYLMLLYNCGIVTYAIVFVMTFICAMVLIGRRENIKTAFIVAILSLGLTESSLFRPEILCMPVYWMMIFSTIDLKLFKRNS